MTASPRTEADELNERGNRLFAEGARAAAAEAYRAALRLEPDAAALHFNLANALAEDDAEAALAAYRRAAALAPGAGGVFANMGNLLRRLGRPLDAADAYRRAIVAAPGDPALRYNLGTAMLDLGRAREALSYFEQALAAVPPYPPAQASAGEALLRLGRRAEALPRFLAALRHDPDNAAARLGEAVCRLAAGDHGEGWKAFEARLMLPQPLRSLPIVAGPRLRPDDLAGIAGRHVLLLAEQGLGDSIQFVRYAALLRARGARVTLLLPPELMRLLAPIADDARAKEDPPAAYDFTCPMLSLPFVFGTVAATIPAPVPYLAARPEVAAAWRARVGPRRRARVGAAWFGNPEHLLDHERSLPVAGLGPLLAREDIEFHALHPAPRAGEVISERVRTHFGALDDFTETAGLIAQLDAVVSVDTSVAHLAGAMGKPLHLLLQRVPDFRWGEAGARSPWYPTARLHRQDGGGWGPVIAGLARELGA